MLNHDKMMHIVNTYSISPTSMTIIQKVGMDRIFSLARKNELFSTYREECHEWLDENPDVREQLSVAMRERYKGLFDGEIDILLEAIPFEYVIDVLRESSKGKHYKKPRKLLGAIIEVFEDGRNTTVYNNCSFIGVGFDYLREINNYMRFANLI